MKHISLLLTMSAAAGMLAFGVWSSAGAQKSSPVAAGDCGALAQLPIENGTVTSAAMVMPADGAPAQSRGPRFPAPTIPYCRVQVTLKPEPGSNIRIEMWLPGQDHWNGKFLGTGNGGGGGQIITSALAAGLARGYAVANTDMGSSSGIGGNDWGFGIGHPELQKDWEYRATDGMTVQGKLITTAYYGQKPKLSYFQGCSTGGLQGWQQAQRMPDAYDGIVSGDPSPDIPNEHLNRVWGEWQNLQSVDATIPKEKMAMVTRSVIAMCDAKDGVKDSIIADPRRCNFDPMSLVCKAGDGPDCLTPRQVQTLKAIYDGPRNPRTGARIAFGPEPGAESAVDLHWAEKVGPKGEVILSGRTAQWSKTYVANHPDGVGIDWDKDVEAIDAELTKDMNNSDPHLGQFQKHGKLIMYQGWEDGLVPAMDNVEFYEQIAKANGGIKKTQNWTRLFMVPGMGHCAGGVGTDQFDPLAALEGWVEHGLAPERIIATRVARGELTALSRPLCAYPAEAVYAGSGDTNDAANFVCKAPAK